MSTLEKADRATSAFHALGFAVHALRSHTISKKPLQKNRGPLIDLWLTKRFKVKGDPRLVKLYKLRITVERNFKAGKLELMMEKLR